MTKRRFLPINNVQVGRRFTNGDRVVCVQRVAMYHALVRIEEGPGSRRKDPVIQMWLKQLRDPGQWIQVSEKSE